jgi:hypothetical protein
MAPSIMLHGSMPPRPFKRSNDEVETNEFAQLWIERTILRVSTQLPGILRWFPVTHCQVFELSPLENAIETMQNTYRELRTLVQEHMSNSPTALKPLSLKLNGIIDAAVMGGTAMYERAFFSPEFRAANPDQRERLVVLENLLAEQIPLLEVGIKIHDAKKSEDLKPLHDRLTIMFQQMKEHVEAKYGVRQLGPEFRMPAGHHRKSASRASICLTPAQPDRPAPQHGTPGQEDGAVVPSGLAAKSRQNLMAKLQGGVNRKKSRASEERMSGPPRQAPIRPIPEQCEPNLSYSSLGRNSRVSVPSAEPLGRSASPVASLASQSVHSNRDSVISCGSVGSDGAPPVPPKQAIGRTSSSD